jgi:two-component system nitrate/nitrite response regulator NarL
MRRRPFATILVGSSALLRECLARVLSAAKFRVVASASRVHDVVLSSLPQNQSILLIIDTSDAPDAAVGQIELFKEQHPTGRIAVLVERFHPGDMISAFRAGANVYFIKAANCGAFIKALELVMLGETILPPEFLSIIDHEHLAITRDPETNLGALTQTEDSHEPMPRLSAREKCILRCILEGGSNKAIARKIDIAEATVKVHVKAILRKIRVRNRTQAAIWALNNASIIWSKDLGPAAPPSISLPLPSVPETRIGPARLLAADNHDQGAIIARLAPEAPWGIPA